MDAKTGKVLYSYKEDVKRYPASLTKMMTMYLMFEALDTGVMSKNTRIRMSKHAASEQPSKLYIPAGKTIRAEDAIYALATKSANDVATAVGEHLGGSEASFANLMTRKARQLGMKSTTFKNANGLTAKGQMTTARDMAILGIALREHYPQYYKYFGTRNFRYGKKNYRNHNRLLGRVRGVDGIKTGYTRLSGFNLVSSVETGGRSIVAVVLGGRTGKSRNAQMTKLINSYLRKATKRSKKNMIVAAKQSVGLRGQSTRIAEVELPEPAKAPVPAKRGKINPANQKIAKASSSAIDPVKTASTSNGDWQIQIAATPSRTEAVKLLDSARSAAPGTLNKVKNHTETVKSGSTTLHRARFVGFTNRNQANKACNTLKKNNFDCIAVKG